MIIKVLFGQRKEDYEGQYAPEALEVMDEFGFEENAEWLEKKLEHHKRFNEFVSLKIIDIKISNGDLDRILNPDPPTIKGEIK